MSRWRRTYIRARSWIAIGAAYALALQLLLSGLVSDRLMAVGNDLAGGQFVICHTDDGGPDTQGGPAKRSHHQAPCVLCVSTQSPSATLPAAVTGTTFGAGSPGSVVSRNDERVLAHHSPTGHYQRGPPTGYPAVG